MLQIVIVVLSDRINTEVAEISHFDVRRDMLMIFSPLSFRAVRICTGPLCQHVWCTLFQQAVLAQVHCQLLKSKVEVVVENQLLVHTSSNFHQVSSLKIRHS